MIKMLAKIYTTVIFLTVVFFSAQTKVQKEAVYKGVSSFAKGKKIIGIPKIEISDENTFFQNAKIYPIYKLNYVKGKKNDIEINNDAFLIWYQENLFHFFSGKTTMLFQDSSYSRNIKFFIKNNKDFKTFYLIREFSFLGSIYNCFLSEDNLNNFIVDEKKYNKIDDLIENKYGSYEKYRDYVKQDSIRGNLTLESINEGIKNYYVAYEHNCPKDSALVFNKFITQLNFATKGITINQEKQIRNIIDFHFYPNKYWQNIFSEQGSNISNNNELKSKIQDAFQKDKEKLKSTELNYRFPGFTIYNVNFTNYLLEILSEKQFNDYKNYLDIHFPQEIHSNSNFTNIKRMIYGKGKLINDGVISDTKNEKNLPTFNQYVTQLLSECGCKK